MPTPLDDAHRAAYEARLTDPSMNDPLAATAGLPKLTALDDVAPDTQESEEETEAEETEAEETADPVLSVEYKAFDDMSVAELREAAELFGLDTVGLKKADLIDALNEIEPTLTGDD